MAPPRQPGAPPAPRVPPIPASLTPADELRRALGQSSIFTQPNASAPSPNPLRRGASKDESVFRQASEGAKAAPSRPNANGSDSGLSKAVSTTSGPPSIEEMELAGRIRQLFFQARSARRYRVSQWNRSYRILRNRTWSASRDAWLPTPEVPEIYPIIAACVGWQTDQRPTWEVVPFAQPNSPHYTFYNSLANDLEVCLDATWVNNEGEAEVEQAIWDGYIYGTGIFKTGWDSSLVGGLGDACLRRVDPYTFYPDPQGTSMRDCNYFIEARTMSIQELDRRWPGSASKVMNGWVEDVDTPPTENDQGTFPKANPAAITGTNSTYGRPGQSRIHGNEAIHDPGVTVFEAWVREHQEISIPGESDSAGIYGRQHVYDTWRVIVTVGNRVIMNEAAEDLWSHGQHPYERYVPHRTGEFWGLSMVEMLTPSQLSINRLLAALQLNVELTGNPVWIEETRAGISRTKITNRPGTRLQTNPNSKAGWEAPPPVNPMMSELIRFYIGEMERISGLSAITRGVTPQGRNAQGVIDQIQEAAFVRIRMALRNLEWSLQACGTKLASLITENYTEPRMVAIIGQQEQTAARALRGDHFYLPTPQGRVPMRFQLNVQAGSQQATSRMARIAEADALFAMGAIDEIAVLEIHDFPNYANVAKRVMELKATGAMQPPGARQRSGRSS